MGTAAEPLSEADMSLAVGDHDFVACFRVEVAGFSSASLSFVPTAHSAGRCWQMRANRDMLSRSRILDQDFHKQENSLKTYRISQQKAWGITRVLALLILAMGVAACSLKPITVQPQTQTYVDENGLFTAEYPAGWVVDPYGFGDEDPTPHVSFGSQQEILLLSMAGEPLPEDQIGMSVILLPQAMEPKITAETPLDEVARLILASMAPPEAQEAMPDATFESITLENGTPAVRFTMAAPTEAYVVHLAEMGDGVYLLAPQILAPGYENAELQAQVEAIINSVKVTASSEEIMAFMMGRMGETE